MRKLHIEGAPPVRPQHNDERTRRDGDAVDTGREDPQEEKEEIAVVHVAHHVEHPWAVVVLQRLGFGLRLGQREREGKIELKRNLATKKA